MLETGMSEYLGRRSHRKEIFNCRIPGEKEKNCIEKTNLILGKDLYAEGFEKVFVLKRKHWIKRAYIHIILCIDISSKVTISDTRTQAPILMSTHGSF